MRERSCQWCDSNDRTVASLPRPRRSWEAPLVAVGETAAGPNEHREPRNLMRGSSGSAVVYLLDPRNDSKDSTTPCRTSRSRVDPSRVCRLLNLSQKGKELHYGRVNGASFRLTCRFALRGFRLRLAGMEPPRSQPLLESIERRPVLFLPAGGTCFYRLSFTSTQIPGIQK